MCLTVFSDYAESKNWSIAGSTDPPRSVSVERCLLGDLHLISPESARVGQLASAVKRQGAPTYARGPYVGDLFHMFKN